MTDVWVSLARISVHGGHSGTGFLVAGGRILTARHVVADGDGRAFTGLKLEFFNEKGELVCEGEADVEEKFTSLRHDFALLKPAMIPSGAVPFVLSDRFRKNRQCSSPGFAVQKRAGFEVTGKIRGQEPGGPDKGPEIGVQFDFGSGVRMKGHSGAPVIANGTVVGLLRTAFKDADGFTAGGLLQATPIRVVVEECNRIESGALSYHAPVTWPPPRAYALPLAGRRDVFADFQAMMAGRLETRVFLLRGPLGAGTSALLRELVKYASTLELPAGIFDQLPVPPLSELHGSLVAKFRDWLPATEEAVGLAWMSALVDDLAGLRAPLVLGFDSWHKSSPGVKDWVEASLLRDLDRMPGLVVLIAGEEPPNFRESEWEPFVRAFEIGGLSVDDWAAYARMRWPAARFSRDHVQALALLGGSTREVRDRLAVVAASLADGGAGDSDPALANALEAASVPRWFDDRTLALLLDAKMEEAVALRRRLAGLDDVETVWERQAWNVQQGVRNQVRRRMLAGDPGRLRDWSAKLAEFHRGDGPEARLERIYHLLTCDPVRGAREMDSTVRMWQAEGRRDWVQKLGSALDELSGFPLDDGAHGWVLVTRGWIGLGRLTVTQVAALAREALAVIGKSADAQAGLATAHTLLGDALKAAGDLAEAQGEYREALRIRQELRGAAPADEELGCDLADSLIRSGSLSMTLGANEEAQSNLTEAVSIFAAVVESSPARKDRQRDLANARSNLGAYYRERGQYNDALRELEASRDTLRWLVETTPEHQGWRQELSTVYLSIGAVCQKQGKHGEALGPYQDCRAIREDLVKAEPYNLNRQRDVAVAYNRVGSVLQLTGQLDEAQSLYRMYRDTMQELVALDPGNLDWQRELSISYGNLGRILELKGSPAESLKEYQLSRQLRQELVHRAPEHQTWRADLLRAHKNTGRLHTTLAQHREALAEHQAALAIAEALAGADPENAEIREGLEECRKLVAEAQSRVSSAS